MGWEKIFKLGAGSYGCVYLAVQTDSFFLSTSLAAVKTAEWERSTTLMKEANFLTQLQGNPYIVEPYGEDTSFEGGKVVYNLLMEYAPKGTLDGLIKAYQGNYMPESEVALYSYMLLKGLSHVHDNGIVHCDIKPSNVLVFQNSKGLNHLKLADFGLAKYLDEKEVRSFNSLGQNRGTLMYSSPESVTCGLHGKATDIWSFGCTVFEMMTGGRRIWKYDSTMSTCDLLIQIVKGSPKIPEYISQPAKDFLMKCLQKNPYHRWTTDMLLDHPFITENIKSWAPLMVVEEGRVYRYNPLGCSYQWFETKGQFTACQNQKIYPLPK